MQVLQHWKGRPFSETLNKHLEALHSARKAFIESENSERIRKALKNKICTRNESYVNGDLVWYKRKDGDRALGPGKVVFQDGKILFVRHGMNYVRVSVNRVVKKGNEFMKRQSDENSTVNYLKGESNSAIQDPVNVEKLAKVVEEK